MISSGQPSLAHDRSIPPITASPILLRPLSFRGQDHGNDLLQTADPYTGLVEGKPELKRVVAINDYHDSDERNFQFDAGDDIAVFECAKVSLGVNLRTGRAGIFPPSCVSSFSDPPPAISTALSTSQRLEIEPGSSSEAIDLHLRGRFSELLIVGVDPKAAFGIVKSLKGVERLVFWGLFCVAYPAAALPFLNLEHALHEIHAQMHDYDTLVDLIQEQSRQTTASLERNWRFSRYSFQQSTFGQWIKWYSVRDVVKRNLLEGSEASIKFKEVFIKLPRIEQLNGLPERLEAIFERVRSEISRMDDQVEFNRLEDIRCVREQETATRNAFEDATKFGLQKTSSFTSSSELPGDPSKIRSRAFQKFPFLGKKLNSEAPTDPSRIRPPVSQRIRQHFRRSLNRFRKHWWDTMNLIGETPTVLAIVSVFSLASAATTALATWKCTPPDTVPTIDSNFWSTVSSAIVGTASLYCTIIPILLQQELKVRDERLFGHLLASSLVAAIAAVVVYPFQTRASLVLLALSSYAQLATTLQIIMGAVTKIQEDVVKIEGQQQEIAYLRGEIGEID
ncbi:hypothetical protein BKA61DRAFT_673560 [Leptodontidium sp. MPI-SDFR-AT-0119]|nr:hypothetical protein BKA61DRAFT_673560 [Leptodontidium sp. MPI-SDFR-AT-0119]